MIKELRYVPLRCAKAVTFGAGTTVPEEHLKHESKGDGALAARMERNAQYTIENIYGADS